MSQIVLIRFKTIPLQIAATITKLKLVGSGTGMGENAMPSTHEPNSS